MNSIAKITDCYDIKDALKSRGWWFNRDAKSWEKEGDWTSEAEVESEVRKYAGVRNRRIGNIEIVAA